jgi:hypothetical protein
MAVIPDNLKLVLGRPNDGTGDDLYTAFNKLSQSIELLDANLGATTVTTLGSGTALYAGLGAGGELQLKGLVGSGGISITANATDVVISGLSVIENDTSPTLGGNLSLNNFNIVGPGDVQTSVWGLDIRTMNQTLQTLLNTADFGNTDLGTFANPNAGNYDLGTF